MNDFYKTLRKSSKSRKVVKIKEYFNIDKDSYFLIKEFNLNT